MQLLSSFVRQGPQYTLAALEPGVYVLGMKDQLNVHDLRSSPLGERIQYVADEMGFILYDKSGTKSVDAFGPYHLEQYVLMEVLTRAEVAQNVLEYYVRHKARLQQGLDRYSEAQGKGFVAWRFIQEHRSSQQQQQGVAMSD